MATLFGKPIGEQLLDQGLHAIYGAIGGAILGTAFGMPSAGVAVRVLCGCSGTLHVVAWVMREYEQWPPNEARPWDPYIDSGVALVAAVAAGVVVGVVV